MNLLNLIRACALMLLAAACVAPGNDTPLPEDENSIDDGKTIEEMRAEAWEKIDKEACAAKGGVVRQEGMLGMPRCTITYADAGEICRDASDCEGRCMGNDDVTDYDARPGEVKGVCEANDSPFGCYAEIRNGTADAMLCVD